MPNSECRMAYQHQWLGGECVPLPVGKVVCVGRNYAEHAKELNNPIPTEPLLFMKPATALVDFEQPVSIPTQFGDVHYESEIAVLIGEPLVMGVEHSESAVHDAISGIGAALDLTLRSLQSDLKAKGQPWEKAKAFDGACPISPFIPVDRFSELNDLQIGLSMDGQNVQAGNSSDMLTPIVPLLQYITKFFSLKPGDVVLTGTPKGVGSILPNQTLCLSLDNVFHFKTTTC